MKNIDIDGNSIKEYEFISEFVNVILQTINFSLTRENSDTHRLAFGIESFNRSFRTLRLSIPRQMGNSRIAGRLLNQLNACLFVDKPMSKKYFSQKFGMDSDRILTEVDKLDGKSFEYIVVDNASKVSEYKITELFKKPFKFFILIQ